MKMMKGNYKSRRDRNPHKHGKNEKKASPFFSKDTHTPFFNSGVQTKLSVGKSGDKYEKEADRMADSVVNHSKSKPLIQNKEISTVQKESLASPQEDEKLGTAEHRMEEDKLVQEKAIIQKEENPEEKEMINKQDEEEEETLQAKSDNPSQASAQNMPQQLKSKSGKGKSLSKNIRAEMETSFGTDFSDVNIHTDKEAVDMNKSLNAQAFTYGRDVFFNSGKYDPGSAKGKHLLAHELTHVVQQGGTAQQLHRKIQLKSASSAAPTTCGKPAECPAPFCSPFPNQATAIIARSHLAAGLLVGIAGAVSPRVVPLWSRYLFGGSGPTNITASFGADFTLSQTTANTTAFLVNALKARLTSSPPTLPAGKTVMVMDISSLVPTEIKAINTPFDANEMNFNVIGEIPGNIAGGIGTTQVSCPVGARPSPFNDTRLAKGRVILMKRPDGSLLVQPFINYKVKDTIDLCPGNCGALKEQVATIPMSMMEASGISGDVPLIVDFNSMPIAPFVIHPPVTPPSSGEITASKLRIRTAPNLSAPILDKYPRGAVVNLECQVLGSSVRGNRIWFRTDRGFISGEYVRLSSAAPKHC